MGGKISDADKNTGSYLVGVFKVGESTSTSRHTHSPSSKDVIKSISVVLDALCILAVLPYFRIYEKNTRQPIKHILEMQSEAETRETMRRFFQRKISEIQYVQVAGAVMFTSVIQGLAWPSVSSSHWSGPALWYASIILAISAVVVGAQQSFLLPDLSAEEDTARIKAKIRKSDMAQTPRSLLLFGLQCPLLLLSYSMLCFLGGLSAVVLSPLAQNPTWAGEAKVRMAQTAHVVHLILLTRLCFPDSCRVLDRYDVLLPKLLGGFYRVVQAHMNGRLHRIDVNEFFLAVLLLGAFDLIDCF